METLNPKERLLAPVPSTPNPTAKDANPSLAPGAGTFFDESVDLQDGKGTAFTAQVLALFDEVKPRKRRRSANALKTDTIRIRRILANAMRAHFYREVNAVLFFSKADSKWYADKPSWMRHGALREAVEVLASAGLLRTMKGKLMPGWSKKRSYASSYAATNKLIGLANIYGISATSVKWRVPEDRLVRLFGPKQAPVYDWHKGGLVHARKGKPIAFEHSEQTRSWTDTLLAINAFYREQEIGLALSPAEQAHWIAERNADPEHTGAPFRLPELFQTAIYRVFNNGDQANPTFEEGGRLFGGWWMSVPSELRTAISINGQKTTELDYGECHPRMLYHLHGIEPVGDLYRLPHITHYETTTGAKPDTYRNSIKWLTNVLINGKGRPDAVKPPQGLTVPPDIPIVDIIGLIEARHQPIADAFNTGVGMQLMRLESDIALEIVSTATGEGWTALSIHDSFIAPLEHRQRLEALMIEKYQQRLGHRPKIKVA